MKKFILWAMFVMAVGLSSCSDVEMPETHYEKAFKSG